MSKVAVPSIGEVETVTLVVAVAVIGFVLYKLVGGVKDVAGAVADTAEAAVEKVQEAARDAHDAIGGNVADKVAELNNPFSGKSASEIMAGTPDDPLAKWVKGFFYDHETTTTGSN